ncbi:MAG: hypothetical protein KDA61_10705 [Planctomycetales bacterium]|nr:hypothetical protein [Planctomycetales bacterium]
MARSEISHADVVTPGGVIDGNLAYSLSQVAIQIGLGSAALRKARREGLVVRRIGRKSFILGKDLLAYLEKQPPVGGGSADEPA